MKINKNGITLIALIITIIILVILAGVSITYVLGDNGVVANAMKMELETAKGEIRDHLLLNLNDELLSCSADIYGTSEDISTRYNEVRLINFLAGYKNFSAESGHEDVSAVECIEPIAGAGVITPKRTDIDISGIKDTLFGKGLITNNGNIYNQYRIIPENLSPEVDSYGKGNKISDGDIFVLEAVTEDGTKIGDGGASTGKYQLNYYDKDGKVTTLEKISLYMTNQS